MSLPPEGPDTSSAPGRSWRLVDRSIDLLATKIMGIVNVTPDSFSDGGAFLDPGRAAAHAELLVDRGASLIDVGGESTRPGAPEVSSREEAQRVIPVLREIGRRVSVPISIDTTKAAVARAALDAGATIVNDVSGMRLDPKMPRLVAASGAGVVLMHMRGRPRTMQSRTDYEDVVKDVLYELSSMVESAIEAGVEASRIVVDPGIGFAKTAAQSLLLLKRLDVLATLGRPILVGPSRKSFIGAVTGAPVENRLSGTIASVVAAVLGGARIVRVHDVPEAVQASAVADAIRTACDVST